MFSSVWVGYLFTTYAQISSGLEGHTLADSMTWKPEGGHGGSVLHM